MYEQAIHKRRTGCVVRRGNQGFTLVELIVVLVIMGILTAAILPVVTGYIAEAKERVAESNAHMVEEAARLYLTDQELENGSVSSTSFTASSLVTAGYLSALPAGEDYTVTVTVTDGGYNLAVAAAKAQPGA